MPEMKPIKLIPKKTAKGWCLNIPAQLTPAGKRQRQYFPSRDAAERKAAPLREMHRAGESRASILPPSLARLAERAFQLLENRPPEDIVAAALAWMESQSLSASSVTFRDAAAAYREAKSFRTHRYLENFRRFPDRFSKFADTLISEIKTKDIEREISALPASARNTTLSHLAALWSFAIRREWARENPIQKVERAHVAAPGVPVLTAKQLRRLFVAALRLHPEIVPMMAIETFAGVRPAEAAKIRWEDIDPADNVLTVTATAAKTRRARHVTLHPQAVAWLDWHRSTGGSTTGTICPHPEMTLRRYLRAIHDRAGIKPWPQDCLRHTFASVALAAGWRDIGGLCLDLGHTSQAMLHKHYHRAIRKVEADRVFAVAPPQAVAPGKIVRMAS